MKKEKDIARVSGSLVFFVSYNNEAFLEKEIQCHVLTAVFDVYFLIYIGLLIIFYSAAFFGGLFRLCTFLYNVRGPLSDVYLD